MKKAIDFGSGFLVNDFPLHSDSFYEMHLFYKGKGTLVGAGFQYIIEPHLLTISPPHEEHRLYVQDELAFHIVRIHEPGGERDFLNALCVLCRDQGGFLLSSPRSYEWKRYRVLSNIPNKEVQRTVWYGVMALLSELSIPSDPSYSVDITDPLMDVMYYMDQNLNRKITLEDLASLVNLTPSRLSHLFKERTGRSPIDYFLRLKVDAACYLLESHDYVNKELATLFGFSDEYHFSKIFKKKTGISPKDYRQSLRKGKLPPRD
ncbi:helix-turn-helix domain-containing protein [Spirochaeta cellobiosiphila]|uniref:helix-turn-helix domain-containing protein n=1 Tax=Spirochaeta cellobiosiphila TaxID=504483 RepID=UPI00040C98D3|nr:AraC family transcriptional regulator [Spirochaeta cellobiosiphila]